MAKYFRIGAVAPAPLPMNSAWDMDGAVQEMRAHWERQLRPLLPDSPDLIVLPEACDRPEGLGREESISYYAARGGRMQDFFSGFAREHSVNIAYAAYQPAGDGTMRNSIRYINRAGGIEGEYHKNHLVIEENTQSRCLYGKDAPIVSVDGARVGGVICFDLNFRALRDKYRRSRPELLTFSSMYHGGLMQAYWAYDCRCHFVSAVAGLGCAIINPVGETVARSTNYHPYLCAPVNLDCQVVHLDYNWEKLDALRSAYRDGVRVFDPGLLGSILVSSETEGVTAGEMLEEFGIETLDHYMERALRHREEKGRLEP